MKISASLLPSLQIQLCSCRQLQASISERLLQSERLVFQQEALSSLYSLLSQDLQRYQKETQRLTCFTQRILTAPHRYQHGPQNITCFKAMVLMSTKRTGTFAMTLYSNQLNSFFRWDQEEPCRRTGCSMQEKTETEQGSNMDNMVQSGFTLTASVLALFKPSSFDSASFSPFQAFS